MMQMGVETVVPVSGDIDIAAVQELLPDFELVERIGRGGMGVVYKARQLALDRVVAIKLLSAEIADKPGFAERFGREAKAMARLNHPNVVAVYDCHQSAKLCYLVMEFIDGANLRELTQTGRLSPSEALAIVPQICDALQYAHDQGIVHRDIKPENILIDRQGRVKIADFGLAKLLDDASASVELTRSHMVMGTPRYMSPEQVETPLDVDHRADIYSLGVVIYELLTGELPMGRFAAPSEKVQIDVRLDEVVLRTLEKEPQRRYQQASEVKTDMESIARTYPGANPGANPGAPAIPPVVEPKPGPEPKPRFLDGPTNPAAAARWRIVMGIIMIATGLFAPVVLIMKSFSFAFMNASTTTTSPVDLAESISRSLLYVFPGILLAAFGVFVFVWGLLQRRRPH
jgi:serine/threonine protein kinase